MIFNRNNNFNQRQSFVKSAKKEVGKFTVVCILVLVFMAAAWYVVHPSLNVQAPAVISNVFFITIALAIIIFAGAYYNIFDDKKANKFFSRYLVFLFVVAGLVAVLVFATSSMFNAKEYASRITIKDSEFTAVSEVDFSKTPIIDRASTIALGDRVMGQMPELVSQFEVSNEYTQISYKDSVYRVTPLEYAGVVKYFTNRDEGIPAYITVNSTTGEAELVKLADLGLPGMRYVPSGLFNENLQRKLQMDYPFDIFGTPSFEIDEEGHPWYICTTYKYKVFGNKLQVAGVVVFDPITGDSTKYTDILEAPSWIDRVYPESLVTEEINNYGSLKDGFINSVFGQKNVWAASQGYNYLEKDGDIWIYSGITSVNSDAANLGFVLANLRTHEALKINSPGADETSAMRSAEGEVKNYGYYSTFPLLVNVSNKPVYLVALKDNAGLIKMYAMVDASDYQRVVTVSAEEGLEALKRKFINYTGLESTSKEDLIEKTITISDISFYVVDNSTRVFITSDEQEQFKITLTSSNEDKVGFLKAGDMIKVSYHDQDGVKPIDKIN